MNRMQVSQTHNLNQKKRYVHKIYYYIREIQEEKNQMLIIKRKNLAGQKKDD